MEPMTRAAVSKAHDALVLALSGEISQSRRETLEAKCKAFAEYGLRLLASGAGAPDWNGSSYHLKKFLEWQTRAASGTAGEFANDAGENLTRVWLASIADYSLLDSIAVYSQPFPPGVSRVMIASGFTADPVAEGGAKAVRHLNASIGDIELAKTAALLVLTMELVNAGGPALLARFEYELQQAVTRGSNLAVLSTLAGMAGSAATLQIATTGDALADLRAGVSAAPSSMGYVVAGDPALVRDLALRTEAPSGFTLRGGEFRPGLRVVAVEEHNGLTVIPCSRLALFDAGLELRSARHATVEMADPPTHDSTTPTGAQLVNLWQTNNLGLLAERSFHIAGDVELVEVAGS